MLTRRDVFRGLGLSVLAVGAVGVLDACGDDKNAGGDVDLAMSDTERSLPDPADVGLGVSSMHALGAGLWGELTGTEANLAISPFSVAVALGMTVNGAVGATRSEMLEVLSVDSPEAANAGYNAVAQYVESLSGPAERWKDDDAEIVLDAANSLFGQIGTSWEKPFFDALAASYGAGMQQVDYKAAVEAARAAINGWTAEQTRDKIPELIPSGVLDELTRLVLVNALYLRAPWDVPFEEGMTKDGEFHLDDGSTTTVPMMRSADPLAGATGAGWRSARLPYAGGTLAMTVVLADDADALVAGGGVVDVLAAEPRTTVSLTMPRWTFRSPSPLKDALVALGMPTAFDERVADFSGMTRDEELHIAAVLHEVWIAVDEKGTEAAAATAVVMSAESAAVGGEPLVLDRPFLFVIHDVEHGTPLFIGRVGDPS